MMRIVQRFRGSATPVTSDISSITAPKEHIYGLNAEDKFKSLYVFVYVQIEPGTVEL